MIIKTFKGGSLSNTVLMEENNEVFVRKFVSLLKNREYGFIRWYSQLKKIQRYYNYFPALFPKIIRFGNKNDYAFFDMPYYKDMINAHTYICSTENENDINLFLSVLIEKMNILHSAVLSSPLNTINLYLYEEVKSKIKDASDNDNFKKYLTYDDISFNDNIIPSFIKNLDKYEKMFTSCYNCNYETKTHGNITLENLLYNPSTKKIMFIDLYEENIIDTPLGEYSQLLQSSNSKYELYNKKKPIVKGNKVSCKINNNKGLSYFNNRLTSYLKNRYSEKEFLCIKLFEVSQFIRMLPFKVNKDINKTIFFYSLASYLFNQITIENEK